MKIRQDIKFQANVCFKRNYWPAVGFSVLTMLLPMIISFIAMSISFQIIFWSAFSALINPYYFFQAIGGFITANIVLSVITLLVVTVLQVGLSGVCINIYNDQKQSFGQLFEPFKNYGRNLGGMLWMDLWIFLWSLLFVVPGIVKAYSYFATPYILAHHKNVAATQAIEISKRIMQGNKGKVFVAQLSFIGWFLLSGLTLYILGVFYVYPYYNVTMAGFFEEIKYDALERGVITKEMLDGTALAG